MSPRNSLILAVVVLVAVAGYVYFTGRGGPEPADEVKVLVAVDAAELTGIVIEREGLPRIRMEPTSDGGEVEDGASTSWRLVEPVVWDIVADAAPELLRSAERIEARAALADDEAGAGSSAPAAAEGLEAFGLGASRTAVTFETATGAKRLFIGHPTPVGANFYAQVEGDDRVYTIPATVAALYLAPTDAYRERSLLSFQLEQAEAITLTTHAGTARVEFDGETWRMTEPWVDLADADSIRRRLTSYTAMQAIEFVDAPQDLGAYGLDAPSAELRIVADTGDRRIDETVLVGAPGPEDGTVWVKFADRPTVFLVGAGELDLGETVPLDLFERDLVLVEKLLAVRRIELVDASGQTTTVRKEFRLDANGQPTSSFDWWLGDDIIEPRRMTDFLTALVGVKIQEIGDPVSDEARAAMRHYQVRVHMIHENGAEELQIVRFGEPDGEVVPASVDDRPLEYRVSAEAMALLQDQVSALVPGA